MVKSPRPARAPRTPLSDGLLWIRLQVFIAIALLLFASTLEWLHYRELTGWSRAALTPIEVVGILWVLCFKSLLVVAPAWALSGLALRFGKRRLAVGLTVTWTGLVLLWQGLDLGAQRMLGAHLDHYLPFIKDVVFAEDGAQHAGFGGSPKPYLMLGGAILGGVLVGTLAAWLASGLWVRLLSKRLPRLGQPLGIAVFFGVGLLVIGGVVPVQMGFTRTTILRRLHGALPIDVGRTRLWAASLGRIGEPPRTVRIVSLRPDPRGDDDRGREEIGLHNFSANEVSLAGWSLGNAEGQRLPLSGSLAANKGLMVVPPADGPFVLNDQQSSVMLYDPEGVLRHEAGYTASEAVGGMVIKYRDEDDFDAFSARMNELLMPVALRLQAEWDRQRPADLAAKVPPRTDGSRLPDVLVVALESMQHGLFNPDDMPRVHAWAQTGLTFDRHYSASNMSHYGLYGMLYGRVPLFYAQDLERRVQPQMAASLKQSGYHTTFIASTEFRGWRDMEHFLNTDNFDEVLTPSGAPEGSAGWVQNDEWMFAEVRRRLSQPTDTPRFIFVYASSTHYPYEYPERFAKHLPAGVDIDDENWTRLDPQQLRNRYRNSAAFTDHVMGETLDAIDLANTVVAITGDHGESLGEDGVLSHGSKPSEIQLRVPFAMSGPGVAPGRIETATSHLDLLPSLLHVLAGSTVPTAYASGRDLFAEGARTDEVLLNPRQLLAPYELVLIQGKQRLLFKVRMDRPSLKTYGFINEIGDMELERAVPPSAAEAQGWVDALTRLLDQSVLNQGAKTP